MKLDPKEKLLAGRVQQILGRVLTRADWQLALTQDFHPEYRQWVDGKELDYRAFCAHIHWLRSQVKISEIGSEQLICQQQKVFSCHRVAGEKADGSRFSIRVLALFQFEAERIIRTDEMSCVLSGDDSAKRLAQSY